MKKILFIFLTFILVFITLQFYQVDKVDETIQSVQFNKQVDINPSIVQEFNIPKTLIIPKIDINADVESVAKDTDGNMDVPRLTRNVAWYNLGYKPGEKGNAVMAGHFDTKSGQPAVFWDLNKLIPGDEILIKDNKGKTLRFEVTHKKTYPYNNFPIKEVFGDTSISRLNLITCGGEWNSKTRIYSDRIVVFTRLIES